MENSILYAKIAVSENFLKILYRPFIFIVAIMLQTLNKV